MTLNPYCDIIIIMKEIVNELINNGYEAYIVGGYVRDYLLGIPSYDIDICTNASIDEISKIFKGRGKSFREYYAYHIEDNEYSYDITTYRKEHRYRRNKPVEISVAKSFQEDLLSSDFTINTFAIDKDGKLIEILGAKKDLDSRLIRVVGDTEKKLTEDKTRIIRAIRFSCTLDFDLDPEIMKFIENKKSYLLNEVPKEYKRSELDKIFESNNIDKFFYLVKRYKMERYFNIKFNNVVKTYNKYGIWAQIETDLPFSNKEIKKINTIKELVNKKDIYLIELKQYDNEILYNVASILKIEDKLKSLIEILKLRSIIDLDINLSTLFKYVDVKNIKSVYKQIERSIMEGYLQNNKEDIEYYLRNL